MKTMEQISLNSHSHLHAIPQVLTLPPLCESFTYEFDTSLKHSNATQNVYFSNYFEWQGAVRER